MRSTPDGLHSIPRESCKPGLIHFRRQQIHAGRTDEVTNKSVLRPVEQLSGFTNLDNLPFIHHNHLLGKSKRLSLIVRDVDHGEGVLLM